MDDEKTMALKEFFKGIQQGFHTFGKSVNTLVNTVLLSITYILGVGLASLLWKRKKKRGLDLQLDKEKKSYYEDLNLTTPTKKEYLRQF